jgi:putative hydrolase of the HAD superfamily
MFPSGGSIRAVLFDAVGTLIRPEPGVAAAYLAAARRHRAAGNMTEDEAGRRFRIAFDRQETLDRAAGWSTSEARERQRWQAIVGEVFGEAAARDGLFETLWNHFADPQNWSPIEAARPWIDEARRAGLTIGVASNFDARLHPILAAMPELNVGTNVFVSSEIGWRKPSPEFFHPIESRLELSASELLLVGDDMQNDIEAAKAAGWQGTLLNAL